MDLSKEALAKSSEFGENRISLTIAWCPVSRDECTVESRSFHRMMVESSDPDTSRSGEGTLAGLSSLKAMQLIQWACPDSVFNRLP